MRYEAPGVGNIAIQNEKYCIDNTPNQWYYVYKGHGTVKQQHVKGENNMAVRMIIVFAAFCVGALASCFFKGVDGR